MRWRGSSSGFRPEQRPCADLFRWRRNRRYSLDLVEEAKRKGVPIDVYPLSSRYDTEVLVESLTLPPLVAAGEPYDLRAVIISNVATPAELSLYRDGSLVVRRLVELEPGRNVIAFEGFELPEAGDGIVTYEMRVNPVDRRGLQNNVGYGLHGVEGDRAGPRHRPGP